MNLKVRIDTDKIPIQCIDHKASQTELSYGKISVIIVLN